MDKDAARLIKVFKSVFTSLASDEQVRDASMAKVREWDSLSQMNLMVALHEEFDLNNLRPEDFVKLTSFKIILNYLQGNK
jgi:acyl carrier protein